MCCPFIVCIVIGVSNKAYSDTCDCLLNEFQVTPLHKQLQEHTSNWEYVRLSSGYVVAVSVAVSWRSHLSICVCVCLQAATRSPQCSAMLRLQCCVLAVPQSSASLQEEKLALQKVHNVCREKKLSAGSQIYIKLQYIQILTFCSVDGVNSMEFL